MSGPEKVGELYIELKVRADEVESTIERVEGSLGGIAGAGSQAQRALDAVGASAGKVAAPMGDAGKAASGLAGTLTSGLPVAVGTVSAAFAVLGAKALSMAEEVNESARKVELASVNLSGRLGEVREIVRTTAVETGRAFDEVGAASLRLAQMGVEGPASLAETLRVASDLAKATSTDFERTAAGLSRVLQVFDLSATDARRIADDLYGLSQRGVPFDDLIDGIESVAPQLARMGGGFDLATKAMAAMIAEGMKGSQAAKEIRAIANSGVNVTERLQEWADLLPDVQVETRKTAEAAASLQTSWDKLGLAVRGEISSWGEMLRQAKEFIGDVGLAVLEVNSRLASARDLIAGAGLGPFTLARYAAAQANPSPPLSQIPVMPSPPAMPAPGGSGRELPETEAERKAREEAAKKAADEAARLARELERVQTKAAEAGKSLAEMLREAEAAMRGPFAASMERLRTQLANLVETASKGGAEAARAASEAASEIIKQTLINSLDLKDLRPQLTYLQQQINETPLEIKVLPSDSLDVASAKIKQLADSISDLSQRGAVDEIRESLAGVAEQANGIADVAWAIAEIGVATGLLGEDAAKSVGQFLRLADTARELAGTVELFKAGGLGLGGVLSGGAAVAGALAPLLSGVFGESPEAKAAKESLDKLRAAVDRLREEGIFGANVSGNAFTQFRDMLADALERGPGDIRSSTGDRTRDLRYLQDALKAAGFESLDQIYEFAKQFDLDLPVLDGLDSLPAFFEGLRELQEFMNEGDLTGWSATFTDQLARMELEFRVMGTGAAGQFKTLIDYLTDPQTGAPGVFEALKDLDISTADGAEAAKKIIQGIVAGFEGLENEDLGELTQSQVLQMLERLFGYLPDVAADLPIDKFAEVAKRFSDLNDVFRAFDISGVEALEMWLQTFAAQAPDLLNDLIAGFDLTSVEGLDAAEQTLQSIFSGIKSGAISIDGTGLSLDHFIDAIMRVRSASGEARAELDRLAREEERLAEQRRREAEQAQRQAEADARERERRAEQARREAERAHQEHLRRIEEERRARQDVGADTLRAMREMFGLFDVEDLTEQLESTVSNLIQQAPAFRMLGGLDVSDAGGRAEMLRLLREFALANPFGQESGNLSRDVVRAEVLSLAELIKQINEVTVTTDAQRNESYRVDRTITEVTGDRIASLLGTANILAERGNQLAQLQLDALNRLLTPSTFSGLTVPALQAPAMIQGNTNTTIIQIHVAGDQVSGTVPQQQVAELREIIREIVRSLMLADQGVPL